MTSAVLSELRDLIDETQGLHQLNLELLDVSMVLLRKMIEYCDKAHIPYDESAVSLVRKATTIYDEIHASSKLTSWHPLYAKEKITR